MSRGIKFRAWDIKNKAIREVWSITWDFTPEVPKMILACNPVINSQYALYDGDFVLMEFTGLKDKNGKEIYEGDVMSVPEFYDTPEMTSNRLFNWAIIYMYGAFHLSKDSDTIGFDDDNLFKEYEAYDGDMAIIGNIYENPELLKPQAI